MPTTGDKLKNPISEVCCFLTKYKILKYTQGELGNLHRPIIMENIPNMMKFILLDQYFMSNFLLA